MCNVPYQSQRQSLRDIAKILGISAGYLSKIGERYKFPWHIEGDSRWLVADEVREWMNLNVHRRRRRVRHIISEAVDSTPPASENSSPANSVIAAQPSPPPATPTAALASAAQPSSPSPPPPPPLDAASAELSATLTDGKADMLTMTEATVRFCSWRIGRAIAEGRNIEFGHLEDLKRAFAEFRQAKASYLDLAERERRLVPIDMVRSIVSSLCSRLVAIATKLENAVVMETEIWLSDPAFLAMNSDDRRRKVRNFVHGAFSEIRRRESEPPEATIARVTCEINRENAEEEQ